MQLLSFGRVKHVKVKSQKWMVLMSLAGTESHIVWLCLFFFWLKKIEEWQLGEAEAVKAILKVQNNVVVPLQSDNWFDVIVA